MDWATAAQTVSAQRVAAGLMSVPPDPPLDGEDEIAFWDEVERLATGTVAESFTAQLHPRDFRGRWRDKPGEFVSAVEAMGALEHGQSSAVMPDELPSLVDRLAAAPPTPLNLLRVDHLENLFRRHAREIPRSGMPQIPPAGMAGFMDYLREHGVEASLERRSPVTLTATQNQLDGAKIAKIVKRWLADEAKAETTLIVSEAYEVADGHHRWAAGAIYAQQHPNYTVGVLKLEADIDRVLALMHAYAEEQGFERKVFGGRG